VQSAEAQAAGEQADLWASGPVEALDHAALEKLADGQRDKDTLVVLYAPWCQYSQVSLAWVPLPFESRHDTAYDCNLSGSTLQQACEMNKCVHAARFDDEVLSMCCAPLSRLGSCYKGCTLPLQAMEGSYSELAEQLQGSHVRVAKFQADVDREFAQERFGLKTFPTVVMLPKAGSQVRMRLLACHLLEALQPGWALHSETKVDCTQWHRQ
jgi:hypothetical protein